MSTAYASDRLPWVTFARSWERAEEALARLDQTVAMSDLREAWIARADLAEACASVWLEGEAVALADLVLHDAHTAPGPPTPGLVRARSVLLDRRALARRAAAKVLTVDGILQARDRRRRHSGGREPEDEDDEPDSPFIPYDPHWHPERRLEQWLEGLAALRALPALPAAALAFHAWQGIAPVQHGGGVLGRLIIPVVLRDRGKTRGHDLCLAVGLREARPHRWAHAPLGPWMAEMLESVALAAEHGLEEHRRLMLAKAAFARPLAHRRRSSHLGDLADLILRSPVVSAPMAARRLGLTPKGAGALLAELVDAGCIRELTGRSRYRAFAIV